MSMKMSLKDFRWQDISNKEEHYAFSEYRVSSIPFEFQWPCFDVGRMWSKICFGKDYTTNVAMYS